MRHVTQNPVPPPIFKSTKRPHTRGGTQKHQRGDTKRYHQAKKQKSTRLGGTHTPNKTNKKSVPPRLTKNTNGQADHSVDLWAGGTQIHRFTSRGGDVYRPRTVSTQLGCVFVGFHMAAALYMKKLKIAHNIIL